MSLFIETPFRPFRPSLCALFCTRPRTTNKTNKESFVESITKRKTFLYIHPPTMEIPEKLAKNTIELSIKRVTFTSGTSEKPSFPRQYSLFSICLSFSWRPHKNFTMTLKSKFFNKILHLKVSGNVKICNWKNVKKRNLETKQKAFYSNGFDCVFT